MLFLQCEEDAATEGMLHITFSNQFVISIGWFLCLGSESVILKMTLRIKEPTKTCLSCHYLKYTVRSVTLQIQFVLSLMHWDLLMYDYIISV